MVRAKLIAAFLAAIFFTFDANSAIIWVGGEDSEFQPVGGATLDQTAGRFRSGYARGALYSSNSNVAYWRAVNVFSRSSLWIHFSMWATGGNTSCCSGGGSNDIVKITDVNGVPRLVIRQDYSVASYSLTPSNFTVQTVNAANTHTQIGSAFTAAPASGSISKVDIHISNYGAAGTIKVYINSSQVYSYTGNIATDANTLLNGIDLGSVSSVANVAYGYSEIIVADTDSRSLNLVTVTPAGAGSTQQWTCDGATAHATVNTWSNADTTSCVSGTANQVQAYSISALPSFTNVHAVVTSIRSSAGATGPQNIQHSLGVGGTTYSSPTAPGQALTPALLNYQNVWSTNPSTGTGWNKTDLTAPSFEFGFKSQN